MVKKRGVRNDLGVPRKISSGKHSKNVAHLMDGLNLSALNEVDRKEFESMVEQIQVRTAALTVDNYTRKLLVDSLKTEGAALLRYESDLVSTQEKLSGIEKDMVFHKQVLQDLKKDYLNEHDSVLKKKLLESIDCRQEALQNYQRLFNQTLEIRNKIRKEIDRNATSEAALKLKEKELKSNNPMFDVKDVDFEVLK